MVCQPVVMSSAESLPTSGGANQIIANIGQVRLQPKQQRPQITGRQQIFFRVRRPTTPVVAAATAANTNNVRYLTPRSAVTLASAAGGIVRSAAPIIQQNAVSFRGSRGGRPRGASPRQLRPQIAANNPVFVSAGSSPQITGSQVVHVKRSNLSMMSPDDLPDLPLDIQVLVHISRLLLLRYLWTCLFSFVYQ